MENRGAPPRARRRTFRPLKPCAPLLVGLAALVMLWGLGYRLSLYRHHASAAPRTPVAKLWASPRSEDQARIAEAKRSSQPGPGFHIFSAPIVRVALLDGLSAPNRESGAGRCSAARAVSPSRAPPYGTIRLS